jgi:hypothetical protein
VLRLRLPLSLPIELWLLSVRVASFTAANITAN